MKYILGKKIGMTQVFNEKGDAEPVTVLELGPCRVTQILTGEKNGYFAIQIGYGEKKMNKPQAGHLKDFLQGRKSFSVLREFSASEEENEIKKGDEVLVTQFEKGEKVNVRSTAKSKGFQGVVKRWNFAGGPASHGQKHSLRTPGSIGSAYPQHVLKGKKMAGRMGGKKHTVRNLRVIEVLPEENVMVVRGAVPGHNGTFVEVTTKK